MKYLNDTLTQLAVDTSGQHLIDYALLAAFFGLGGITVLFGLKKSDFQLFGH
jgi:hypothetical protein